MNFFATSCPICIKELPHVESEVWAKHKDNENFELIVFGREHVAEEIFEGSILRAPVGDHGFGYDPLFRPQGFSISSAQMSADEKDLISHRGKSLRAIAPHVISLLTSLG